MNRESQAKPVISVREAYNSAAKFLTALFTSRGLNTNTQLPPTADISAAQAAQPVDGETKGTEVVYFTEQQNFIAAREARRAPQNFPPRTQIW